MRYWPAIALGLGIVALIALVLPLVQSQRHLSEVRAELGRTNEQLVQAAGTISNLKAELDSAQSQLKDWGAQVQGLTAELEKGGKDADQKVAAEHEASQTQIEALSKATDEAKAKLSEAEKRIADLQAQLATGTARQKIGSTQRLESIRDRSHRAAPVNRMSRQWDVVVDHSAPLAGKLLLHDQG